VEGCAPACGLLAAPNIRYFDLALIYLKQRRRGARKPRKTPPALIYNVFTKKKIFTKFFTKFFVKIKTLIT